MSREARDPVSDHRPLVNSESDDATNARPSRLGDQPAAAFVGHQAVITPFNSIHIFFPEIFIRKK
ncbi:hypothetical protein DsansV1_C26g0190601 [Dioscorea sansibarensis]